MLLVFFFHVHASINLESIHHAIPSIYEAGATGTNLFLLISGCFVYGSLCTRPRGYPQHFRRRILRIYPAYVATLVLYYGAELILRTGRIALPLDLAGWSEVLRNLLFLNVWFGERPVLDATWALQYIFAFYLILPAIVWVAHRLNPFARIGWLAGFVALVWAGTSLGLPLNLRLALLPTGALVWEARSLPLQTAAASLGVLTACWLLTGSGNDWRIAAALLGLPALVSFVINNPQLGILLDRQWLRWLGERSYSFYLTHGMGIFLGQRLIPVASSLWQAELRVALSLLGSILIAAFMYRLVERPCSLVSRRAAIQVSNASAVAPQINMQPGAEAVPGLLANIH